MPRGVAPTERPHRWLSSRLTPSHLTPFSSLKTPTRFSSLTWGSCSSRRTGPSGGILVGGMADGVVNVWDGGALLSAPGGDRPRPSLAVIERHKAPVKAVAFNPHAASSHLIAAGSADGDVSIINLENPGAPTVASPMPAGTKLEGEVTCVAWNTSVTHILASSTVGGVVVVWDLKENKPWCTLRDPHRAAVSEIAWHPDDGLYLVTAVDDDARPVLRVWDLRSSTTTPLAELAGHSKGILSVDWCTHDPNLLVSTGKDSHTFVWDISLGKAVGEIPGGGAPATSEGHLGLGAAPIGDGFNAPSAASLFGAPPAASLDKGIGAGSGRRYLARWSKRLPGMLATCSFDRRVVVHAVTAIGPGASAERAGSGGPGSASAAVEATMARGPKWLRRPVGATWGFGGRLAVWRTPPAAIKGDLRAGPVSYSKTVQCVTMCVDGDAAGAAAGFEERMRGVESGAVDVRELCRAHVAAATEEADRSVWTFMSLLFESDARQHVLLQLGYDAAAIAAAASTYAGAAGGAVLKPSESTGDATPESGAPAVPSAPAFGTGGGGGTPEDFFGSGNAAPSPAPEQRKPPPPRSSGSGSSIAPPPASGGGGSSGHTYVQKRAPSAADDAMLKKALLVGDFASAVAVCLAQERYDDALLLAACGSPPELWLSTREAYFTRKGASPLTPVMAGIIKGDLGDLVATSSPAAWKETLALLCSYSQPTTFGPLCEALGDRLALEGGADSGTSAGIVYMVAMSASKATAVWAGEARGRLDKLGKHGRASPGGLAVLQSLVERVVVFRRAVALATGTPPAGGSAVESSLLADYAGLLAGAGQLTASAYVAANIVDPPGEEDARGAVLRDRLVRGFTSADWAFPAAVALSTASAWGAISRAAKSRTIARNPSSSAPPAAP